METTKFVTFTSFNGEQIIVFPGVIQHKQFAESVTACSFGSMRPISGGFVSNNECFGKSVSLRMRSRPEDTELLNKLTEGEG